MNHQARNEELTKVGPYTIFTNNPIREDEGQLCPRTSHSRLLRYKCTIDEKVLTAKCVQRDHIGTAGKRKSHKKWNTQVKTVTQISSLDSENVLATCEVVKTNTCYWFFQDYDSSQLVTLADFLHSRAADQKLTTPQLRSILGQLIDVFCQMSSEAKFVHGNLDSQSVFIQESTESGQMQVYVDPSEHHMLTRLLKQKPSEQTSAETTTQEETVSDEQMPTAANAFEEFRRHKKVNTQSDIQSLGQIVILLMKQTDLSVLTKKGAEKLSDLVQNCSFNFKRWEQVNQHPFVKDSVVQATIVDASYLVLDETAQAATATQEWSSNADIMMSAPLTESLYIETPAVIDGSTTEWQAADEENKDNSSSICEDLEKLVETGYYELIQTCMTNNDHSDEETAFFEVIDESAFPKGLVVFDNDDDDDEGDDGGNDVNGEGDSSPLSYEDEDGYEVICARELINVPASDPFSQERSKTMIGQGASYVIGQASRLIGNFWAKK